MQDIIMILLLIFVILAMAVLLGFIVWAIIIALEDNLISFKKLKEFKYSEPLIKPIHYENFESVLDSEMKLTKEELNRFFERKEK